MHWRKSTWALIAWTALCLLWMLYSAWATANGNAAGCDPSECGTYVGIAIGIVVFAWLLVAVPLGAYWYTRRNTGNGHTAPLDPMEHWPPPTR
jgi:hypothetical protein